jgi:hypothetical protein
MKRTIAAIVGAMLVLGIPGIALAASRFYRGPVAGSRDASIEITALQSRHRPTHPVRLIRIELNNIPANCPRFSRTTAYGFYPRSIAVVNGAFHDSSARFNGQDTVTLSGHFSKDKLAISGHLRIRGPMSGCASADTGVLAFQAKH